MGLNPMEMTKFGGDPTNYMGHATWKTFLKLMIIAPLAGGCAITYARVNLNFWWGVLLHCLINIPAVLAIALSCF
jgi:hypothetical protein